MSSQQRLLLSIGISMGILLAWTALFPPTPILPTQKPPSEGPTVLPLPSLPPTSEPVQEVTVGALSMEVGQERGGIRSLKVDGAPLLVESIPGLLEVQWVKPTPQPARFLTRPQEGRLFSETEDPLSEAAQPAGGVLTREIGRSKDYNSILEIKLQLSNRSDKAAGFQLKLLAYRPIYAKDAEELRYQEGRALVGGKVRSLKIKAGQIQEFTPSPAWITAQGKSQAIVLKPISPVGMFHVEHSGKEGPVGWLYLPEVQLPPGGQMVWAFQMYAGPMDLSPLSQIGLEEAVSFGTFSGITRFLLELLFWSNGWLRSYGLAILFISTAIWLVFFPLTWSGIRMMKMMGQIQPQVERIRREHAKNPQRMNQEIMELYKKHRVNPLSGCLPLFFQMPIFIALYQVLTRSDQLRGAPFLWIRDLSGPDALIRFPSPIPLVGESLNLLPILMVAAMFVQQQMTQRPQTALSEEQAMQQKIFRWFPLLFGFLFYGLPSGLVLYWVTNTLLTVIQQLLVLKVHHPA